MAGGSYSDFGSLEDFDDLFEKDSAPSENIGYDQILSSNPTKISELIVQSFVLSFIADKAKENLKEDLRASEIDARLHKAMSKIEYTKNGFVLKDDKGEFVKEINSPGKLGLAVFQILNDVIAEYDYEKANALKEAEDKQTKEKDYEVGFWGDITKKITNNMYGSYYRELYDVRVRDDERGADR